MTLANCEGFLGLPFLLFPVEKPPASLASLRCCEDLGGGLYTAGEWPWGQPLPLIPSAPFARQCLAVTRGRQESRCLTISPFGPGWPWKEKCRSVRHVGRNPEAPLPGRVVAPPSITGSCEMNRHGRPSPLVVLSLVYGGGVASWWPGPFSGRMPTAQRKVGGAGLGTH